MGFARYCKGKGTKKTLPGQSLQRHVISGTKSAVALAEHEVY
jgi:hypothetical protein